MNFIFLSFQKLKKKKKDYMTPKHFNSEKKEKGERKTKKKKKENIKRKLIKIDIGILHISHILRSIRNYFIFIIYHHHDN